jgi:hypothetical protein
MKKLSIFLQWVLIIGVVVGVLYTAFKPTPPPVYQPAAWKSWEGFFVLSYAGIAKSETADYVGPYRLRDQLQALKAEGYQTIKLADALAFLQGQGALPEKALLLLFEGNRKDSFIEATPVLAKLGFFGNLCVPTKLLKSWGNFFLKEGEIQKVCRHPNWDLVSMGDQAIEPIHIDAKGGEGHFLSRRLWLADKKEDDEAFRQRLTADYVKSAAILKGVCDHQVIAYLYPYTDAGTGAGADPLAADINRLAVEKNYLLAFTRAGNPFNGPEGDRYNLTRLRVQGDWDGARLVAELARYAPRQEALTAIGNREAWQLVNGPQLKNGVIQLPVDSLAWVRGTDNWRDVDVKAQLHLAPGAQVAVYARYGGPLNYLRLIVTEHELALQERLGSVMQTLAREPLKKASDQSFTLQLKVQGNRAWVWFDNAPVFQSAPLTSQTRMGSIGLGAQNGQVQVDAFAAARLPDIVVWDRGYDQLPPDLQGKTRVIIPPWFSLSSVPEVDASHRNEVLHAATAGVETIPAVAPHPEAGGVALDQWAADLAAALSAASLKPLVTTLAVNHDRPSLIAALEKQHFRVLLVVPARQALTLSPEQLRRDNRTMLIQGSEAETRPSLARLLHFIPAGRLIVQLDRLGPVPPGVRLALKP